jgi:polyhydroxyalkanoate synthesis regulator protein
MQSMVPQYLEASMDAFRKNQQQFQQAMQGAFTGGPFADIAKRNMEVFKTAAPFVPKAKPAAEKPASESEMEQLRAEMAALQAKVDKLSR